MGYGSWFEHVQEFWEHRMDSNVLFLKYEDMHRVSAAEAAAAGIARGPGLSGMAGCRDAVLTVLCSVGLASLPPSTLSVHW